MRRKGENLHSIYILLFLNIAFFFLQLQDVKHYLELFAFDRAAVLHGQIWRLVTYQFIQGTFFGSSAISLFFTLIILYIMGSAAEEEWGTFDFITFVLVSTLASAGMAFIFGFWMIGSFVVSYSLLFAYATMFPEQTFLLLVFPVKAKWLGWIALAMLLIGVVRLDGPSLAAAVGAAASYLFFLLRNSRYRPRRFVRPAVNVPLVPAERPPVIPGADANRNLLRFRSMNSILATKDLGKIEGLASSLSADIVPGVNICQPADYKPEHPDRYCIRCEGFAECGARYLRLSAPGADVQTVKKDAAPLMAPARAEDQT
ncbi:MAG: rhomboid family intramembrane serine protease [Acidobacteriota bacterium]